MEKTKSGYLDQSVKACPDFILNVSRTKHPSWTIYFFQQFIQIFHFLIRACYFCHFIFLYSSLSRIFLDKYFPLRIYHFWCKLFCNQPQTFLFSLVSCQGLAMSSKAFQCLFFQAKDVSQQGGQAHRTQRGQPWGELCREGILQV